MRNRKLSAHVEIEFPFVIVLSRGSPLGGDQISKREVCLSLGTGFVLAVGSEFLLL
jgi:hypothetical protein